MEKFKYNTIEEAIAAIKAGKMVLVTDDEDRENEGEDVYKRQAVLCTKRWSCIMAIMRRLLLPLHWRNLLPALRQHRPRVCLMLILSAICIKPVSYTHLDVYKRQDLL